MYYVILDLGYPMEAQMLEHVLTALQDVLALSSCVNKTGDAAPFIGTVVLNKSVQNMGNIVQLQGDRKKLSAFMDRIKSLGKTNWKLSAEEYKDNLLLALKTVINEYKLMIGKERRRRVSSLRVAVVSAKPGGIMRRVVASTRRGWEDLKAAAAGISTIQVIDVSATTNVSLGWPIEAQAVDFVDLESREDTDQIGIIVQKANSLHTLQQEFKRLLIVPDALVLFADHRGEVLTGLKAQSLAPLRLQKIANAVDDSGTLVICEASPVAVDPQNAPTWPLGTHSLPCRRDIDDDLMDAFANTGNGVPGEVLAPSLILTCRLNSDGVSDGSLFGMPYYLSPLTPLAAAQGGIHTDDYDFAANADMFSALRKALMEREEILLTSTGTEDGPSGNFLVYIGSGCLLLQPLRTSELALPVSAEAAAAFRPNVTSGSLSLAREMLRALSSKEDYNAEDFPTTLYSTLSSRGKEGLSKSTRKSMARNLNSQLSSYVKKMKTTSLPKEA